MSISIAEQIRRKLNAAFAPESLDVVDESARHAGHAGARAGGETHYRVRIVSSEFDGLTRVDRQRRIYGVLQQELAGQVHALALRALTPEEAKNESR